MANVTFHMELHEEPDGSLWGEVKELPGCFASGSSMKELQEAAFEAMQMWLPDGIVLSAPTWKLIAGKDGKKKRPASPRQMLVCA